VGSRRISRELALRCLYQTDVVATSPEEAMATVFLPDRHPEATLAFARQLVEGTCAHREEIDRVIQRHARGWTLERMAHVDRNIMRLAIYELLHLPDIPPGVAVDEAVELAKRYSTAESGRFVNGVLGNVIRTLEGERAQS
jgi:N utilization substance protein B